MTVPFSIDQVRSRLGRHCPADQEATGRASVALILGSADNELRLLVIRRAEHPDDPWSGHMALPGGRRDAGDGSDLRTALRETFEEVGVELERQAELLGQLDSLRATVEGRPLDLVISPFVFGIGALVPLVPSVEVNEALWVPIRPLYDGTADTRLEVRRANGAASLPAWRVAENHIWGLTYRMIQNFFDLMKCKGDG